MTPLLIKSFPALAAVAGHLIVKAGVEGVTTAAGNTDPSLGVSDAIGTDAGGMLDVVQAGWGEVRAGGNVAFGDPLTSDAEGRAIKAVPVAGAVVRTVGFAQADASADDIIPLLVVPGLLT